MSALRLSVVVPCYNESAVLSELHRRLSDVCSTSGGSFEIILIDDGSRDTTWRQMSEIADIHSNVLAVRLSRNFGHQMALTAGLSIARGERVLVIDADLQDPPELLPEMHALMDKGADVVYGERITRQGETLVKKSTAYLFYAIIQKLSQTEVHRNTGDFRMMSSRVVRALNEMPERHRFVRGMVAWVGYKQVALRYDRHARFAGDTKYPFRKMMRFAADAVTAFSIKPLQLASYIGLAFAIVGLGLLVFSVISFVFFKAVNGWTSVMAGVSLMGSVQLLVLGIMGEYLGRLYEQSKGRPLFLIDQVVSSANLPAQNSAEL